MCGCEGGGVGVEWGRVATSWCEAEVGGRVEGGRAPGGEGDPD